MVYYSNNIYPICLVLSYDWESVQAEYTDANEEEIVPNTASEATTIRMIRKASESKPMAVGVVFNVEPTTRLIAHESLHVSCFTFSRLGIPLSDDSEEAWAYYIGWVADCMEDFKRNDKI